MKDFIALQDKYAPGYYGKMRQETREVYKEIGYPFELFAAETD